MPARWNRLSDGERSIWPTAVPGSHEVPTRSTSSECKYRGKDESRQYARAGMDASKPAAHLPSAIRKRNMRIAVVHFSLLPIHIADLCRERTAVSCEHQTFSDLLPGRLPVRRRKNLPLLTSALDKPLAWSESQTIGVPGGKAMPDTASARFWPSNSIVCACVSASGPQTLSHFQDHLVLESRPVSGSSCIEQFSRTSTRWFVIN